MPGRKIPRGKSKQRLRGSSRVRTLFKPRLALWAGVGVFVFACLMACDGGTGTEPIERGSLYVASYSYIWPRVQRLSAKTGEIREGFTPENHCIGADVDPETGDVFVYIFNYIQRYTSGGRLKYEIRAYTHYYSGREHIALNSKTGVLYFLDGEGGVDYYRAEDGELLGGFSTGPGDAEQLLVDDVENTVWVIQDGGVEAVKYSAEGNELLKLNDGPYTEIRVEGNSNTVILGVVKSNGNFLYRYSKTGTKKKEIRTRFTPKALGVEPGTGTIWASDGEVIERFAAEGGKIGEIPTAGFEFIDFGTEGGAAFTSFGENNDSQNNTTYTT
jgi:hypothetical protein